MPDEDDPVNKCYMWGERGLVATFFQDIAALDTLDRWRQFLETIKFPIEAKNLSRAWCIVEPDFGNRGFGHPDAVAYLEFMDDTQAVLFIEAKLTTYEKASWPESRRGHKQFNSKINGQLELNYRLGLALQGFHPEVDSSLAEPEWVLETSYKTAFPGIPRSVKKPAVLELVAGRLAGLSPDCYFHLAITTDDDAPWPRLPPTRTPRLYGPGTKDVWDSLQSTFLWTSWEQLHKVASAWSSHLFCENHDFFKSSFASRRVVSDHIPDKYPSSGVWFVVLKPTLYPVSRPTYLHLSWTANGSYRLRDYSGDRLREINLTCGIGEVLEGVEDKQDLPKKQRKRWQDYEWWHEKTLVRNRTKWTDVWKNE